jgi:hypothetical protein
MAWLLRLDMQPPFSPFAPPVHAHSTVCGAVAVVKPARNSRRATRSLRRGRDAPGGIDWVGALLGAV